VFKIYYKLIVLNLNNQFGQTKTLRVFV